MLLALIVHIPNTPALAQLVGGGLLVVLGLVIWKGKRRADR